MGKSKKGLLLFLVAAMSLVTIGSAEASHVSCGQTIYQDTILDSDLLYCQNDGIIIGSDGITLDCNGYTIDGIAGYSNSNGIYMQYKHNVEVRNCNVQEFKNGIFLESSSGNTLNNNFANSNNNYGIYLSSSSSNTIEGNTALNNGDGIYLSSSSSNTIEGNTASNNNLGIYLSSSSRNTIEGNTALNNGDGIYLYSAAYNFIYNNYFDNTNNAFDNDFNFWNITKTPGTNIVGGPFIGGNFWSDYKGKDTNRDGIGDTNLPYNSNGIIFRGGDYFPLVKPISKKTRCQFPAVC